MSVKKEILEILQYDARITNEQIASMLSITQQQVTNTIREMEQEGIIMKYIPVINTEKFADEMTEAIIELKVSPQREFGYNDIARRVYKFPEVQAVYLMSGSYDLHVKVRTKTMKDISKFVWEKLAVLDGVSNTVTHFIMRKYKENGMFMVEEEEDERLVVTP